MRALRSTRRVTISPKPPLVLRFVKNARRDKYLLILMAPAMAYFVLFHYVPMYGAIIAFKNFSPGTGILHSPWVGFRWFEEFVGGVYFWRLLRNTFFLSVYQLLAGFPIPIIFALVLNEVRDGLYKRSVQTVSYLPHFISVVVIVGMLVNFLSPTTGIVNVAISKLGGKPINFMADPRWFRTIYVWSNVWQHFGWNSIIYLAALSAIDPALYESATIDGAGRWQKMRSITLPGISSTITILLILAIGRLLTVGFEKIILMYSPATYATADVISTYVYRRGLLQADFSYGAAVGLFNSVINFVLLYTANLVSRSVSGTSLW